MATPRLCSIPDCGNPVSARGWCGVHYQRWQRTGDPLITRKHRERRDATCTVAECDGAHLARGFCETHYERWRAHGDPLGGGTFHGEPERFFREVVMTYEGDECLPWPYSRDTAGYANMFNHGKTTKVPRRVCEYVHGPAPTPKHEAAHSCGNGHEACVSKSHLSWKTPKQNCEDKRLHGTYGQKLTPADILLIRSLSASMQQKDIATRFGMSRAAICLIINRKIWAWVE